MTDETLFAEDQLLAADADAVLGAVFTVGHPQIERVAQGCQLPARRFEERSRILHLHDEPQGRLRAHRRVQSKTIHPVGVAAAAREPAAVEALGARAELTAGLQPFGELTVEADGHWTARSRRWGLHLRLSWSRRGDRLRRRWLLSRRSRKRLRLRRRFLRARRPRQAHNAERTA